MNEIMDIPLPQPFDVDDSIHFSFSSLGKLHKKSSNGNKVYKYSYESINKLYKVCTLQTLEPKTYKITKLIDIKFKKSFNALLPETKYAVKVIKAETYRSMVSGLKEMCIMNEIYARSDDLVSKPFFSTPFWNGTSWVYVIVSEFIQGKTINDVRVSNIFTSKTQREEIKNAIVATIYQLWWNGYSHNNLTRENIIYNSKTNSVKLVGLSNCVALPEKDVSTFQNNILNHDVSIVREYQNTFKKQSILYGNIDESRTDDNLISAYYF
jgi:RIO-like serine/threonine protein kinase